MKLYDFILTPTIKYLMINICSTYIPYMYKVEKFLGKKFKEFGY